MTAGVVKTLSARSKSKFEALPEMFCAFALACKSAD
jgi:hypothetical protein